MELLYIYYAAVFYLGTILGSFINVVALDLEKLFTENNLEGRNEFSFLWKHIRQKYFWQSLLSRRSKCDSCEKTLRSHELFPLFSFALQRGVCRNCGDKITLSHFMIEVLSGFYFLGVFYTLFWGVSTFSVAFIGSVIFWFTLFGILFVLALFDYRNQLIPDVLLYTAGLMLVAWNALEAGPAMWWNFAAAGLFAVIFATMWAVSRGKWIGFADAKLAILVGLLLGISAGFTALAFAFWSGALVCTLLIAISKFIGNHREVNLKTAVPFGPFMVFGMWLVFVTGMNLFALV